MLQRNRAETQPCYTKILRPKWRNGRRAGLKNRWENIPCQFESDLRHQFLNCTFPKCEIGINSSFDGSIAAILPPLISQSIIFVLDHIKTG